MVVEILLGYWRCPAAWQHWRLLQPALVAGKRPSCIWVGVGSRRSGWCLLHNETGEVSGLWAMSRGSSLALLVGTGLKQCCFSQGTSFHSQVFPLFICVSDPGSHSEELVAARKPESLETPQPTAENQEMLCGQNSCTSNTSSPPQSSEQSATLEQTPASEVCAGLLPADKAEQGQLKMEHVSSEGSCGQQETAVAKAEEGSCLRHVVRRKAGEKRHDRTQCHAGDWEVF